MNYNNQEIDDSQVIVNKFAHFFLESFVTSEHFTDDINTFSNYNVLSSMRITEPDITTAIKKIKNNMCMGPDLMRCIPE